MRKIFFWMAAGCALSLMVRGETVSVIRDGAVQGIAVPEGASAFQAGSDGVVFADKRAIYKVDHPLGDKFSVTIRMRIEKVECSAASIVLFNGTNANHFIFSGSKKTMWLQGYVFKNASQLTRPAPAAVLNGEFFDLEIKRDDAGIQFLINGESIVTIPGSGGQKIDSIGLRPWGATIRVETFSITTDRFILVG